MTPFYNIFETGYAGARVIPRSGFNESERERRLTGRDGPVRITMRDGKPVNEIVPVNRIYDCKLRRGAREAIDNEID